MYACMELTYFARDISDEAQVDGTAADVGRIQAEAIFQDGREEDEEVRV